MKLGNSSFFDNFVRNIKKQKSFTFIGLTSFSRLLLVNYIKILSGKKVLFITSTEQAGLKYGVDLERLFDIKASMLPYQNTSPYETLSGNIYDYRNQVDVLRKQPDLVIAPVKVLTEKFPTEKFFQQNSLTLTIGDSISQKELLNKLVSLGYKRATMVSDMGEFSIRGDISDIYTLEGNPVRIEFWGDEIVDIRYFNNETQKSIEKIKETTLYPLYKFVLNEQEPPEIIKEQVKEEGYFEGINVYQSYFNPDLISILDYFKDYIIIFDEYAEISAKLGHVDESLTNSYNEALKLNLIYPLKETNHFSEIEIIQKMAGFQKIS